MLWSPLQRLQNQQVQRPLQNLNPVLVPLPFFSHRLFPQSGLPPKVNPLTTSSTWLDRICSLLLTTEPRPLFHPSLSTFYPQGVDTLHPALVQLLCRSGSTRKPLLARALSSEQCLARTSPLLASAIRLPNSGHSSALLPFSEALSKCGI